MLKAGLSGNSAGDLFGMVKTWPFGKVVGDLQIGDEKGNALNHLLCLPFRGLPCVKFQQRSTVRFENGTAEKNTHQKGASYLSWKCPKYPNA